MRKPRRRRVAGLESRIAGLEADVATLDARKRALETDVVAAQGRFARLQAEIAEAEAAPRASASGVAQAEGPALAEGARRSPLRIDTALATAPGLASASAEERGVLASDLARGACVTDALQDALGGINRFTAAALVRGLGDC